MCDWLWWFASRRVIDTRTFEALGSPWSKEVGGRWCVCGGRREGDLWVPNDERDRGGLSGCELEDRQNSLTETLPRLRRDGMGGELGSE